MLEVCCRIRPRLNTDTGEQCIELVKEQNEIIINQKYPQIFKFDSVFDSFASQEEVFQECVPILDNVISGVNGTIFAYGATCCGKTYTLAGPSYTNQHRGIISRSIEYIFRRLSKLQTQDNKFQVSLSFLEIYLEKVRDLLNPNSSGNLQIYDGEVAAPDAFEIQVNSVRQVIEIIERANLLKVMAPNKINQQSSRSHCIIQLFVAQENATGRRKSTLFLADLAGSEKIGQTEAQGLRLDEAKNINKSLLALGKVINALAANLPNQHICYRDSKLTRLLQRSLGSTSRTLIIVHLAPTDEFLQESLYTLLFAQRAKFIKNEVRENRFVAGKSDQNPYAANQQLLAMRQLIQKLCQGRQTAKSETEQYLRKQSDEQFLRYCWTAEVRNLEAIKQIYQIQSAQLPLLSVVNTQPLDRDGRGEKAVQASGNLVRSRQARQLSCSLGSIGGIFQDVSVFDVVLLDDARLLQEYQAQHELDLYATNESGYNILNFALSLALVSASMYLFEYFKDSSMRDQSQRTPIQVLLDSAYLYQSKLEQMIQLIDCCFEYGGDQQYDTALFGRIIGQNLELQLTRRIVSQMVAKKVPLYDERDSALVYCVQADQGNLLDELLSLTDGVDIQQLHLDEALRQAIQLQSDTFDVLVRRPFAHELVELTNRERPLLLLSLQHCNYHAFGALYNLNSNLLTDETAFFLVASGRLGSAGFDVDINIIDTPGRYRLAAAAAACNCLPALILLTERCRLSYSAPFIAQCGGACQGVLDFLRDHADQAPINQLFTVIESGDELPRHFYGMCALLGEETDGISVLQYLYMNSDCQTARFVVKYLTGRLQGDVRVKLLGAEELLRLARKERNTEWEQWLEQLVGE